MGWHAAAFAGQKKLKPLADYLRTPEEKRNEGVRKMIAMAKAKAKKRD